MKSNNKDTPNTLPEFISTKEAIELSGKSRVLFYYAKRLDPNFPTPIQMKHKGQRTLMYSPSAIRQYFQSCDDISTESTPDFINTEDAIKLSGRSRTLFNYAKQLDSEFPQLTPREYKGRRTLMYSYDAIRQYFQKFELSPTASINKDTPNIPPEFINAEEAIKLSGKSRTLFNYAKRLDPKFPQLTPREYKGRRTLMYSYDAIRQYFNVEA